MAALAVLCLAAGLLPGLVIDALAPVVQALVGGTVPAQAALPWLRIVPVAASGSSYNGLLVFLFIAASALSAAWAVHRFASRRLRRAPAWDCGFPDASPPTQYSGSQLRAADPPRLCGAHLRRHARRCRCRRPATRGRPASRW